MHNQRPFGMNSTHQLMQTQPKIDENFKKSELKTCAFDKFKLEAEMNSPLLVNLIGYDRLLSSFNKFCPTTNFHSNEKNNSATSINDRFIPNRKIAQNNYQLKENLDDIENQEQNDPQSVSISEIYSEEILGNPENHMEKEIFPFKNNNILQYREQGEKHSPYDYQMPLSMVNSTGHSKVRKISKIPCKVLDAPALQDDFYLNLIDWSAENQLSVGLGNCIYLWNAFTSKVTRLCELQSDIVSSVSWSLNGTTLAIGCNKGEVLIWDVNQGKQIRKMIGHDIRVGAMAWNTNLLASGSRDKVILLRDLRSRRDYVNRLAEHTQQICGLKWSHDEQYLASGGNDNKVVIWTNGGQVINRFADHKAAVKAISWSPQQHGLIATGGGTADRMIKMRNIFTGKIICEKDTGSQICNLTFSKNLHEIVSTHGYSQNQINIWSYPNMKKTATLIGHTHRVLYLAMSPDGSTIVTGAGDETLRFWNIFPSNSQKQPSKELSADFKEQNLLIR